MAVWASINTMSIACFFVLSLAPGTAAAATSFSARGNEPNWHVEVTDAGIAFKAMDAQAFTISPRPEAQVTSDSETYLASLDGSVPWYWSLLIGLLGIAAGLIVLNHPLLAAAILPATLVIYLGVLGIIIGILAIIGGFTGGGLGNFIFGVLNLLIGILLLSSPIAATLAVPFVFGILLLIEGVALIIWAFRVRA